MRSVLKKVDQPVVDTVRQLKHRNFLKECGVPDCVEGLTEIQAIDDNVRICC